MGPAPFVSSVSHTQALVTWWKSVTTEGNVEVYAPFISAPEDEVLYSCSASNSAGRDTIYIFVTNYDTYRFCEWYSMMYVGWCDLKREAIQIEQKSHSLTHFLKIIVPFLITDS